MPVYKYKDGWRIVIYWLGRREPDKILRPEPGGPAILKRHAEAWEASRRIELAQLGGATPHGAIPTLAAFVEKSYHPHSEQFRKASTHTQRRYVLRALCRFAFAEDPNHKRSPTRTLGDTRIDAIAAPLVAAYMVGRRKAGRRDATINSEVRQLTRVLNFARETGYKIPEPHFRAFTEFGQRKIKVWSDAQVAAILDTCARVAPRLLPVLVCLANTGMRRGEAIALEWENVHLDRAEIKIWPSEEWQPKNNKPREVPISDELDRWLRALQAERGKSRYVFLSEDGDRWALWPKGTWYYVLREARAAELAAAKKAGREPVALEGGPHRFRHTFATNFLRRAGDKIKLLARILGHSHQRVTELYCHVLPSDLAEYRNVVSYAPSTSPAEFRAAVRWGK